MIQAAISRLNTQAAIIGVQDSLHHVQPQLSFLQSLLGMLVAVVHSFANRSLQYYARQSQGAMQAYLSAPAQFCCSDNLQPGLFPCRHRAWQSCLAKMHLSLHLSNAQGRDCFQMTDSRPQIGCSRMISMQCGSRQYVLQWLLSCSLQACLDICRSALLPNCDP